MTTEVRQEKVIENVQLTFPQPCCHWWDIESPNGPESKGKCKKCGEEKMFRNSLLVSELQYDIHTKLEKIYPHLIR